jgi:RimJ/RimL family protein N-acetyltransferase
MLELESARLRLREAEAEGLPALLAVYLSNPAFVATNEGSRGEAGYYDLEMLQRDWWVARMMPGRHMLAIFRKDTGEVVGMADYAEEDPSDGLPWLGALQIAAAWQRQGLGSEAFACLADYFCAEYGWTALRIGVRRENESALAFWRHLGFTPVAHPDDTIPDRFIVMERAL